MVDKDIKKLEEILEYTDSLNELPPSDIVAFNELRSCADLLRLHSSGQLQIKPDFQRDIVWSKPDQTRFIDSLTKQLPIPSMCISLDYKTDKRLIIDGLQRMSSIINFLSDENWRLSELDDIDEKLSGKTVANIKISSRELFERVQNVMIPVTVIRCDYSKKTHNEYLFTIFHRLNSGGVKLNNQEIRNCIYSGSFNNLLKQLANSTQTKKVFGLKSRFANEEMILRFFALNNRLDEYNGKLSIFLNDFMFDSKDLNEESIVDYTNLYSETLELIYSVIFESKTTTGLGKTFLEGLLYGVSQNLRKLQGESPIKVRGLFDDFKLLDEFSILNLKEGLAATEKVKQRLLVSKNCFAQ